MRLKHSTASQPGVALVTPLCKPLTIQCEQADIMTSALQSGKIGQNFADYATEFESMPGAGRRNGYLRVLGVSTYDKMFIRRCGVPESK